MTQVTREMIEDEIALCKEAVDHCMNGSGLQCIGNDVWRQFAEARLRLTMQAAQKKE